MFSRINKCAHPRRRSRRPYRSARSRSSKAQCPCALSPKFPKNGVKASHKVLGFDGAHPAEWRGIGREQIDKPGDDTEFAEGEAIKIRHTDFGKEISKDLKLNRMAVRYGEEGR